MYRHALLVLVCLALVAPALGATPLWTHNGTGPVRDCAISFDGKVVVVSSDQVQVFERGGTLVGTTWRAEDIAINPAASRIVSGTGDAISVTAQNGTELWTRPNAIAAVAFSSDGKTVAGITRGGQLTVYSASGSRAGTADTASTGVMEDLAVSVNGSVIVSTDTGGVHAFTRKGAERWSVELATPSALAMNGTGDLVVVGDGGSVKYYNLTGERVARVPVGGRVRSVAMTAGADLVVAGADDGGVLGLGSDGRLLWNVSVGSRVNGVAVSASGSVVAVASADGRLGLFDRDGTRLWVAPLAGEPRSLALSADGTTVVVGCDEGTAYVFDSGVKPPATPSKSKTANATAANATGTVAAAGTPDGDSGPNATATAGNRTGGPDATGSPNGTATAPLQVAVLTATPAAGLPAALPAAALALLAVWAALRRRG